MYSFDMIGRTKTSTGRIPRPMCAYPPHELASNDLSADANAVPELQAIKRKDELPEVYTRHPLVTASPTEVLMPYSIYVDAVPYSVNDSTIGFYLHNIVTGTRHLFVPLCKTVCCSCGCIGWCSYEAIFALFFVKWSVQVMADGRHPAGGHDKK